MLAEIEQLLVLQDRDKKIRALKTELRLAPGQRKELDARLVSAGAALDQAKAATRDLEVEKKKLELEAQAKRDAIAKFKTQQFQTRKNEEFQALGNEITRFEADIVRLEDRELEIMEAAERAQALVAESDKSSAATRATVQAQLGHLAEKEQAIAAQLREVEAERAQLAAQVEEDLLARYDRLFANKGDSAIVPLEHQICTGCHMKITTQTAMRVKAARELVDCEQCGRLLYPAE